MPNDKIEDKKIIDSRILSVQPIFGRWGVFTGLCGNCTDEHVFAVGGLVAALVEIKFEDLTTYTTVETLVPDSGGHYSLPTDEPESPDEPIFIAFLDSQSMPEEEQLMDFVTAVRQELRAHEKKSEDPKPNSPSDTSSKILTLNPDRNGKGPKKPTRH
jgi:hypothetical protein